MPGTANLLETYSATQELRQDLSAPMANAFIASSFRKAGMADASPEFVDQWHRANTMVVRGDVNITGDIAAAQKRADIIVHGDSRSVAPPQTSAGNNDQQKDAA